MSNLKIAETILNQLGGKRFLAFTGSYQLVAIENGVKFRLRKNLAKAKWCRITLTVMDVYNMEFITEVRKKNEAMSELLGKTYYETTGFKTVANWDGIYGDMLQSCFTETTGLVTKF